jgi:hypothetical protein
MTIESSVRNKVIEMHLNGKKRNEIAYDLNLSSIKISTGSISNIISEWRQSEISTKSLTTTSTSTSAPSEGLSNTSLSIERKSSGQKEFQSPFTKGGPLSNFLQQQITKVQDVVSKAQEDSTVEEPQINLEMDWDSIGVDKKVNSDKSLPQSPTFVKTVASAQPQHKELVANVEDVLAPEDLSLEPEELKPVPEASGKSETVHRSIEGRLEQERVAWDYYGPAWMRILNQIRNEKDQRRHELLVIDRRKEKLSEWKKQLEQSESNLTARETRILEAEPFLGVAKQLQSMGIGMEETLPFIETINEVAQIQNMDIKTAAIFVTQELRLNREFSGIQRQIKMAQGQLKMLNISITQRQPVITTLLKLQQNGIKDDNIIGLSKIIDLSRMGREWTPFGPRTVMGIGQNPGQNTEQGNGNNGGSNNPGSSNSNGNNGYGAADNGNFSINDLIRLNLLKSTTTNMLNRMSLC